MNVSTSLLILLLMGDYGSGLPIMAGGRAGTKRPAPEGEDETVLNSSLEHDSSVLEVDDTAVANASPASEVARVEVPVVSPRKVSKISTGAKSWFVLNLKADECESFADKRKAEAFKDTLLKLDPTLKSSLLTDQFVDAAAAHEFMAVCKRLGPSNSTNSDDEQPESTEQSSKPAGHNPTNATAGDLAVDAIIDVDDIPFDDTPSSTASGFAGVAASSAKMNAFAQAAIGSGASIDVMRWRLPGCQWDIYAYQLLESKEQYWSHKPQMWMLAMETEQISPIFPNPATMNLRDIMNRCNAAGIRAVPCGDDKIRQFTTKSNGKVVNQYVLYGLVKATRNNGEIAKLIKQFVDHCKNPVIREAYFHTITGKMPSSSIKNDCNPKGKYWIKLASGANNIKVREMQSLDQVFLDHDIHQMINLAYATKGASSQNWSAEIRSIAFGGSQG
jgi:hypothetical protein